MKARVLGAVRVEALFSGTWGVCRGLLSLNLKTVRATAGLVFRRSDLRVLEVSVALAGDASKAIVMLIVIRRRE